MVAHFLDSREIAPFGECIVTLIHTSSFRKLFGKNSRLISYLLFWKIGFPMRKELKPTIKSNK